MTGFDGVGPALTVALAMAVGIVAQTVARHLRVPGIILLLAAGVVLGPDVSGVIDPQTLGGGLQTVVGFAVAVILFEGGLNLDLRRLRREAAVIRRLVTWGAIVTGAGGSLVGRFVMGWDWRVSVLFGTLVIVTGPTVITPLLRRIRVGGSVGTVLEAEGVLIDAIGAVVAVVTLEIVVSEAQLTFAAGTLDVLLRIGGGALVGAAGGLLIAGAFRVTWLVPEGLQNVFTLALVLTMFEASDAALPESGIAAVTSAGLVLGNLRTRVQKDLMEFKEQLTVLLIGVLFVLLAADVRVGDMLALGWPGAAAVAALMLVVRPLNVAVSTLGSELTAREKLFLSWIAPRGIVAAAVASLFAQNLASHGIAGGEALRALVFLVIAVTVIVQGGTGGLIAGWLGLRRRSGDGYAVLGADPLGLALGRELARGGHAVVFLESNAANSHAAEEAGFRVIFGNALDERALLQAQIESRAGAIAVTPNEEVNLLFAKNVREEERELPIYVALHRDHASIHPEMVHELRGTVLFGRPQYLALWAMRIERGQARVESWERRGTREQDSSETAGRPEPEGALVVPLVHVRAGRTRPVDDRLQPRERDVVRFLVDQRTSEAARRWLAERGWSRLPEEAAAPPASDGPVPGIVESRG